MAKDAGSTKIRSTWFAWFLHPLHTGHTDTTISHKLCSIKFTSFAVFNPTSTACVVMQGRCCDQRGVPRGGLRRTDEKERLQTLPNSSLQPMPVSGDGI